MNRNFITLGFLLLSFCSLFSQTKSYIKLPQARSGMGVISFGDKVFCAGGGALVGWLNLQHSKTVDIIDAKNLTMKQVEMPSTKMIGVAINWKHKVIVYRTRAVSLRNDTPLFTMDIYDTLNNSWEIEKFTTLFDDMTHELLENKLYFFNGTKRLNNAAPMDKIEVYNLENQSWSYISIPEPRTNMISAIYKDKLYLMGGQIDSFNKSKRVDIYNIKMGTWSQGNPLIVHRDNIIKNYTILDSKLVFSDGEIYDLNEAKNISQAHNSHFSYTSSITHNNKAYFAGGFYINGNSLIVSDTIRIYDAINNIWSFDKLSEARTEVSISKIYNSIVFAGGYQANKASDVIDIFNTKTNTWQTEYMEEPRTHVKSVVAESKVFLVDGDITPLLNYPSQHTFGFNPSKYIDILEFPYEATPSVSQTGLEVFPNPFNNQLTFRWFPKNDTEATLRIFNILGQEVYNNKVKNNQTIININHFAAGTYLVYIETILGILTKKIVKY